MSSKRVRGFAIARPIVYGNDACLIPVEERTSEHTHRWTVAVRSAASPPPDQQPSDQAVPVPNVIGGADDLSYFIRKVSFKLHETIPNPLRTIEKPPFEVTETGWGEFEIQIKIFFVPEANEKPLTFHHFLKLHPWPLTIHSGPHNLVAPPPVDDSVAATATAEAETEQAQGSGEEDKTKTEMDVDADADADVETAQPDAATTATANTETATTVKEAEPSTSEPASTTEKEPAATAPDTTASTEKTTEPQTENSSQQPSDVQLQERPAVPEAPIFSPVRSWQYDEIVFQEPTEALYKLLVAHPPTPLPSKPTRPLPDLYLPVGAGGAIGELTLETEATEAHRLDMAKKQVLVELDRLRAKLMHNEKELKQLQEAELRGAV